VSAEQTRAQSYVERFASKRPDKTQLATDWTVRENLDDGPREVVALRRFRWLTGNLGVPGKSFRAERLYDVDAGYVKGDLRSRLREPRSGL
jgi:hypothetical protein